MGMEVQVNSTEEMCDLMCNNQLPIRTVCKRCGRKLMKPENMKLGMGKTCYKKFLSENTHKKLF